MRGAAVAALLLISAAVAAAVAAAVPGVSATKSESGEGTTDVRFRDVAAATDLADCRWWGSFRQGRILATVGGGVAWGDYDADGDFDLVLTQGVSNPAHPGHRRNCAHLFRNDGDWRFVDVTEAAGLRACGWGYGALLEDVDGDGDLDLHLTYLGPDQLWINLGDGRFVERAGALGLADPDFHSGTAALDYDRDGDLDLYTAGYIETTAEAESARPPFDLQIIDAYDGVPDRLYEQIDGRFVPTTTVLPRSSAARGLGVIAADFDSNGWTDVFVANDRHRNTLLANFGEGRLVDVTATSGVGLGLTGELESGMGASAGDIDANGLLDLVVTNFAAEPVNLYRNLDGLTFLDESRETGLYGASHEGLGWATGFSDFDNDGVLDLYVAQGHLVPGWMQRLARIVDRREAVRRYFLGPYRQPLLLMEGRIGPNPAAGRLGPRTRFVEVPTGVPPGVWRGGAAADGDGDGRVDLFLYSANPRIPSRLLANRTANRNRWSALRFRRPGKTPPAPGTRAVLVFHGPEGEERRRTLQVVSGGSYLGGSAADLHAGLARAENFDVLIRRPGEPVIRYRRLPADHVYVL